MNKENEKAWFYSSHKTLKSALEMIQLIVEVTDFEGSGLTLKKINNEKTWKWEVWINN